MRSRPQGVTIAAILLVLLNLFNFPWPWLLLFPGRYHHQHSSFTQALYWALSAS